MSHRLGLTITSADGRSKRWGGDEPDAADIPRGLKFSTSMPGGFKDLDCALLRRIDLDYPDLRTFDDVRVYGPGNETAWEGRMLRTPRDHGQEFGAHPQAVGYSSLLGDFPAFSEVYVDRDPSRWREFSLNRRGAHAAFGRDMGRFSARIGPGLTWELPNEALPQNAVHEVVYDAPAGAKIAWLYYVGATAGTTANIEAPGVWSTADGDTGFNGPVALTLDDTLRSAALSPAERRLMMRVFVTAAMTPAAGTQRRFTKLASIGSHGLTLRAIPGEPPGVYASDVLAHALPIIAPDLAFTTGADGTIKPTTYAIPHLVFDGTDGADVTLEVNKYHWWDWAVWEGRAFHFNEPGTTTPTWEARLSEGAHLQLEGDDAQGQYNGVVAYFTDPNGRRRSVGPPATNWPGSVARCDVTDATLMDLGETNPVTARGKRRWARMDISTVTTDAGAIQIAGAWLATRALPTRRGTVTLTGMVRHPTMGLRPAWAVRAGDYIRVSDHPADVPRKVIETRYDHDMLTMTCTTDNTVGLVDALLERVGVSIIGAL